MSIRKYNFLATILYILSRINKTMEPDYPIIFLDYSRIKMPNMIENSLTNIQTLYCINNQHYNMIENQNLFNKFLIFFFILKTTLVNITIYLANLI